MILPLNLLILSANVKAQSSISREMLLICCGCSSICSLFASVVFIRHLVHNAPRTRLIQSSISFYKHGAHSAIGVSCYFFYKYFMHYFIICIADGWWNQRWLNLLDGICCIIWSNLNSLQYGFQLAQVMLIYFSKHPTELSWRPDGSYLPFNSDDKSISLSLLSLRTQEYFLLKPANLCLPLQNADNNE